MQFSLKKDPLKIEDYKPGSAAERAGLKRGDTLEAINGAVRLYMCVHSLILYTTPLLGSILDSGAVLSDALAAAVPGDRLEYLFC